MLFSEYKVNSLCDSILSALFEYNGILLKHKKDENLPFGTWMDLESVMLSEISQKDKYHMISLILGI